MSVLVPGQDDLLRRHCLGVYNQNLRAWFRMVEARAWKWVKGIYPNPPRKIFLVIGQTLTPEYAISHQEEGSRSCEISVETKFGVPNIADANCVLGWQFEKAWVSAGFDTVRKKGDGEEHLFSVFLETVESRPMRRIPMVTNNPDLSKVFQYSFLSTCIDIQTFRPCTHRCSFPKESLQH